MIQNSPASPDLSTSQKIRETLHSALGQVGTFEQCALLNYPNYLNIGDHLIWVATVLYITEVLKAKINYAASIDSFSEAEMEKQVGQGPIILQGGGNLGDLWSHHQKFREQIISKYRNRPIIIMPQCIYFTNSENLRQAATVFNEHPNLTLFTRDNYSHELALKYFSRCQVIKSPDMVFHLAEMPLPSFKSKPKRPVLYLCRDDSELNQTFLPDALEIPNLVVQDWTSGKWIYRGVGKFRDFQEWYWRIPGMVLLIREGWQRGLANPKNWISRQRWERFHPYADKFKTLYNPSMHQFSWSMAHAGIYQLMQTRLVITNRLHGHVLCVLLGIPHILLPNTYYKNEVFYESWTYQIPFGRFIKDISQFQETVEELLSSEYN